LKFQISSLSNQKSQIKNQKFVMAEQAPQGTKQRISDCRKRLRRTRATQRTLRIEQDEAVLAAKSLLASVAGRADLSGSEDVFEEAGASPAGATRRFTLPS
jgi:hypothetical protein